MGIRTPDIVAYIANSSSAEIPTEALYRSIVGTISDPKERSRKATSFYNCLNNLSDVIEQKGLNDMLFYKKGGSYISVEDPSLRFYLNLLDVDDIKSRIQLRTSQYPWDVAVSYAGDVRPKVQEFVRALKDRGLSVFYDFELSVGKAAAEKRTDEYLLPLRLDDVEVVGIHSSIACIDLNEIGVDQAADILAERVTSHTVHTDQLG
jgi:hypothetical protein